MSPEKQRIAIATYCGWEYDANNCRWTSPKGKDGPAPHYSDDLTAMNEAWECLGWEEKNECVEHLKEIVQEADCEVYFATAAQRAEAFLRTLSLWEED